MPTSISSSFLFNSPLRILFQCLTACKRQAQTQAEQNPSKENGKQARSPASNQNVISNGYVLGKSGVILVISTIVQGRLHTEEQLTNANQTYVLGVCMLVWFLSKELYIIWRWGIWEELREEKEYDQINAV